MMSRPPCQLANNYVPAQNSNDNHPSPAEVSSPGKAGGPLQEGTFSISIFGNVQDSVPKRVDLTWGELVEGLEQVSAARCTLGTCPGSECPHKYNTTWSPACWADGATRKKATVECVSLLVYDLDDLTKAEFSSLQEQLKPYRYVIVASHSDRPHARRMRLVVQPSRSWTGAEHDTIWRGAADHLGLRYDRQTKDASRVYFVPTRPSDAVERRDDGSGFIYILGNGRAIDVEAFVRAPAVKPSSLPTIAAPAAPRSNRQDAIQALGDAWPDKGRHQAQLALAGALARSGWPEDEIAEFCAEVAEIQEPGNARLDKRRAAARSSHEKLAAGEAVSGWPSLEEHVDRSAVVVAMRALGILRPEPDPAFADAMTRLVQKPLSRDEVRDHLKATRNRLQRSTSLDKMHTARLLGRVLKPGELAADESDLAATILEVLQAVPPGTPNAAVAEVLVSFAGRFAPELDGFIVDGRKYLAEHETTNTDDLERDALGKPRACQHNLDIALRQLGITMHYDEFARRKIIERDGVREIVQDHHVARLRLEIERELEFLAPADLMHDYLTDRAHGQAYHPVRDYLAGVEATWDGVPRVERWLIEAGAEDTEYVRAVSRIVLVAAVRRVRQPGCQFDEMLIIEGPQGCQKTTALEILGGEWYGADLPLGADTQKLMERTAGRWIIEAGELRGMTKSDHRDLKEWLTLKTDTARMAYGREPLIRAREFIVIGTTNDDTYLRDATGDRRYWPVCVDSFDVARLRAERDQLWAEAAHLESQGMSIRLEPRLWSVAAEEQEARHELDTYELTLAERLGDREGCILCADVYRLLDLEHATESDTRRIGAAMRRLGWKPMRKRVDGKPLRAYGKGCSTEMLELTGGRFQGYSVKIQSGIAQ